MYSVSYLSDTDSDHAKDEDGSKVADKASNSTIVAKEHFVFTDPDGQLYHFSVEGNAIKDGTKVPAESSLGKPCISQCQFKILTHLFLTTLKEPLLASRGRATTLSVAIPMATSMSGT